MQGKVMYIEQLNDDQTFWFEKFKAAIEEAKLPKHVAHLRFWVSQPFDSFHLLYQAPNEIGGFEIVVNYERSEQWIRRFEYELSRVIADMHAMLGKAYGTLMDENLRLKRDLFQAGQLALKAMTDIGIGNYTPEGQTLWSIIELSKNIRPEDV